MKNLGKDYLKKSFKNFYGIFFVLLLSACTSTNTGMNRVVDIFGTKDTGDVVETGISKDETIDDIKTEEKTLTSENTKTYLSEIKNRLRNGQKRELNTYKPTYKVLVGEYLVLNLDDESNAKIVSSPLNTKSKVNIKNGKLFFRTIYRGNYGLYLYKNSHLTRKINIVATSKNNFSEKNIYDVILKNSSKSNKTLKDAVTLYKIYYPNGKNYKNVNYELLKYGYNYKNNGIINEALEVLKSDINFFDDEKKNLLLDSATLVKKKIFIPESLYSTDNSDLQQSLVKYIKTKDMLDKKDKKFLEKNFPDTLEEINKEKDNPSGEINSNEYKGIEEDKKVDAKEKNEDKKIKTYYELMNQNVKMGDKIKALRYFSLIKQLAPNSEWAKKAEKLVNTIK